MKLLAISDLHIISEGDKAHIFFEKFINLAVESDCDIVVFLGDIFDIMVGSQKGYLSDYDWYFGSIKRLLDNNKIVYFFEGNHDFHLDKVFHKFLNACKNKENFYYKGNSELINIGGKKVMLMHGDDLDLDNESYRKWKSIYTSMPFRIFVNHLMPYPLVKWLGSKASSDSKNRNRASFDYEAFKQKYRDKAEKFLEEHTEVDILVAGHTHIKDKYEFGSKWYLNGGFPKKDNSYIQITDNSIEVLEI